MTDCLRLTAYLGERQRVNSHFAADEILDLFSRRRVANSVLLRGIAGFGAHHILRTDESLTLSEDPPVVIAAVDVADVIAPLADDVAATIPQGLVTVESARLLDAPAVDSALPADAMVSMSIALGRNRHVNGVPVFVAVCDLLYRNHFAGATALLGVDGTSHGERRRARFFGRNLDVPLAIVAVGTVAQMNSVFPALQTILDRPLLSVERVQLCKRNGVLLAEPGAPSPATWPTDGPGWQKLIVHTSEATRHDGVPIHRALVRRLRESRAANGATALRGIRGFHGDHPPRGDALIQFGRQVPVMTVVVDTPANIMRSFEIVDELTADHGLVTCQTVGGAAIPRPGPIGG
ncbi:MAG: DUF190 domain-containing protein [Mycobacterium sp.]|nr:DUF190 domain-containing protein [Mycobacterium sp.]